MKLESIVYDYSSLQNAIATTLNKESPTFQALYPSDTATSLTNVLASYGAMLQYQIVSAMANMYTDSAYSEAGIRQLAETLGNRLHGNISSEIYVSIERTNLKGINNVIIPAGSKFTIGDLNFFNPNSIVFPLTSDTLHNIKLIQGLWQTAEYSASGVSGEKIYFCEDFKCNTNMVNVYVNGEQWDITDTFLPYVVTDTEETTKTNVVILRTESDGRTFIKFGNNTNGIIPSANTPIKIEYVYNEGANGNLGNTAVDVNLASSIYYVDTLGKRTQLEVKITPTSTASGGFDTQSLEVLKESSPYVFGSGQRAVRRNDYKSMLLNQCGYLTANVWGEYEEAAMNGGYDKIMMNMVYYSGIKSIQKYDLQPVTSLNLSLSEIQDMSINFYTIDSNIVSARGFLGSYVIDISSFDSDNNPITVKYRDAQGTGILTCDPSINSTVNNFEEQVFPINDLLSNYEKDPAYVQISTNQKNVDGLLNNPEALLTGIADPSDPNKAYRSSGLNENNQPVLISFDNPFQIRLDFDTPQTMTAFAFKTSGDNKPNFIHQFAIYGTSSTPEETDYSNVKNNKVWQKLTGIQTFNNNIGNNAYTDWITTNVYTPGTSETLSETFNSAKQIDEKTLKITELVGNNYTYKVKIDGITQPNTTYYIDTITNTLTFVSNIIDPNKIILYGTLKDWQKYQYYVIEVYSVQDSSSTTSEGGQFVSLRQIKALSKDSTSTINYNSNNNIRLNLPILTESNVVESYTIPHENPYSKTWLSDENKQDQTPITPDVNKVYFVTDQNTYENTIELINGGSQYSVNDILTISNYKLAAIIEERGHNYKVNEIIPFSIGPEITVQMKVTSVDSNNGIDGLEFINGTEYTGVMIDGTAEGSTPSYYGSGEGSHILFSTQEITGDEGNNLQIKVLSLTNLGADINKIETFEIIDSDGKTVAMDQKAISHYKANGSRISAYGTTVGTGAEFKVTSKAVSTYTKKTYTYDTNIEKYRNDAQNIKSFALPVEMDYYTYNVTINGFTQPDYTAEDILTYNISADNYTYVFTVKPINLDAQLFEITLEIDDHYPTNILRGKSGLNIKDASFADDPNGKATITITSTNTVNVYGSYTGNYYTNTDIQALDLPIIDKYNHFTTYLEFKQPHIKNVTIEINVEYENVSTYQDTKAQITKVINSLFDIKPYSIGATLNVSDIWKAINSVPGIKRFNVLTPIDNIDCMPYELIVLPTENLIINDIISNNGYK